MTRYAAGTSVPVDRTQAEIGRTLERYGVEEYAFGRARRHAEVRFFGHGRQIRFVIPLPDPEEREFTKTPTQRDRTPAVAREAYEQAVKQRWRALNLLIKAKLEAVAANVQTFEDEFLAYTLLPNGMTVAESVREPVARALASGNVPELLPPPRRALTTGES